MDYEEEHVLAMKMASVAAKALSIGISGLKIKDVRFIFLVLGN